MKFREAITVVARCGTLRSWAFLAAAGGHFLGGSVPDGQGYKEEVMTRSRAASGEAWWSSGCVIKGGKKGEARLQCIISICGR